MILHSTEESLIHEARSPALAMMFSALAAWMYGALPWLAWGVVGGVLRMLWRPEPDTTLGTWLRVAVRSGLVGLVIGVTLSAWVASQKVVPEELHPMAVALCGFGSAHALDLGDRVWRWISAHPWQAIRRIIGNGRGKP